MNTQEGICELCINNKKSIFYNLPLRDKLTLQKNHSSSHFKKGELIYKEGDKPMGLLCLSKGKVKIFKEGVGGREQIMRMAKPTGFVGFRALFAEENYNASAVALEESAACILDRDSLYSVIRSNGEFALSIIKTFANELGFSNVRTVNLTQKHIRGRLAESLLFLKDTYGYEEDHSTLKVYLSREDLANLSNMTTSNAIRTLSTFANEKLIAIDGRKIKIIDLVKLEKISELG
ncbi:MAG: Crp/Fnr family transcriptional regulator [Bacteroidia bacterium]|nr:Crp/Fnr family transcriptional regulator [Bacteroidia bacterium]